MKIRIYVWSPAIKKENPRRDLDFVLIEGGDTKG